MAFLLEINGTLELTFFELDGVTPVTKERKAEIQEKLQSGDFAIGLASKEVLNSLELNIEAKFEFEVCDDTNYSFESTMSDFEMEED